MKDINATVIVDFKNSEEEIISSLHKDARWGIGKAKREGLDVEELKEEDFDKFYEIYKSTVIDGGTNPSSEEEIKKRAEKIFVCKKHGEIIAVAGIWFVDLYNKEIPRLYLSASLKEYQKYQPNNLLYWNCILWAKEKGYPEFDLGGWQINAQGHLVGINKFKEKWGKVTYYEKDYSFYKALGRKLIRNVTFFNWLNKMIKRRK